MGSMAVKAPESTESNDMKDWIKETGTPEEFIYGQRGGRAWTFEIPGRLPGLNEYIDAERRNRYKGAQIKHESQDYVILCIRQQLRGLHLESPVILMYTWIEPNRRRDRANVSGYGKKIIEDALVKSGVLKDDGWDEILNSYDAWAVDKYNPRIIVRIIPCLDITTTNAVNTTEKAVSASPAPGITTDTRATSSAATDTSDGAANQRRRARITSGKQKKSSQKQSRSRNK